MTTATSLNLPPMSSPKELARLTGVSESTIRRCIRMTKPTNGWHPLPAKRLPGGGLRITADAAARWIASFPDA